MAWNRDALRTGTTAISRLRSKIKAWGQDWLESGRQEGRGGGKSWRGAMGRAAQASDRACTCLCIITSQRKLRSFENIRVIAAYYSRISMSRLTELLDLPPLTTERTLCKLVTDKTVHARINRPAGVVTFKQTKSINEVLNVWSGDIGKMLSLVEKTSHLVSKVSWTPAEAAKSS